MNRAVNSISLNIAEGAEKTATRPLTITWKSASALRGKWFRHLFSLATEATLPKQNKRNYTWMVSNSPKASTRFGTLCDNPPLNILHDTPSTICHKPSAICPLPSAIRH
jgi:hypothetical protein